MSKFDLTTHIRGRKGNITSTNPYRLICREGIKYFERPVGSGTWYYENGEIVPANDKPPVNKEAKAVTTHGPVQTTQKLIDENENLRVEIAKLRAAAMAKDAVETAPEKQEEVVSIVIQPDNKKIK